MKANILLVGTMMALIVAFASIACAIESEMAVGVWLFDAVEENLVLDSSGSENDGNISDSVRMTTGRFGNALELSNEGEASYVTIPDADSLDLAEYSITAWIKVAPEEVMPTENAWQLLLGKWQSDGLRNYGILVRKDTGVILAQCTSGGSKQYMNVMGQTELADGQWHHVTSTYNGSVLRVYVDGNLEVENECSPPDMNEGELTIGGAPGGLHPMTGVIDDVGLFSAALKDDEIKEVMTSGLQDALDIAPTTNLDRIVDAAVKKALAAAAIEEKDDFGGVDFSGKMEGEFGHVAADGDSENDFTLAKVELGADVSLNSRVSGSFLFQYQQGDDVTVDEGAINFGIPVSPSLDGEVSFGILFVPFGEFNSHFIANPYTKDIGETKQAGLRFSASNSIISGSVVFYNEEIDVVGGSNSQIGDMAAGLVASTPEGALGSDASLSAGISFIRNVAGTDGINDMIGDGAVQERTAGLGGFASFSAKGAFLEAEFVRTMNDIQIEDGGAIKPIAFNLEAGLSLPNMPVKIAGKYEQFAENGEDYINRYGGVMAIGLFGGVSSLAVEFLHTVDGDNTENCVVSQLAVEF